MATKRRKTKYRRKSRKSCKYGKLKRPIKTKSGRKRRCKKKSKSRKSRKRIKRIKRRTYKMAELSDMPDEILVNIFENSNYNELSNLYKTDERMRGIAIDIIRRKYTQFHKDLYLMRASNRGDTQIVRMLIKAGAKSNLKDDYGHTALMLASMNGHTETVRMLVIDEGTRREGVDINEKDNGGQTPLMHASENNHLGIVRILSYSPDIIMNTKDRQLNTALMLASNRGYTEIVRMLLKAGADRKIRNVFGDTALIDASENGHTEIVDMLLKAAQAVRPSEQYTINIQNGKLETALMLASKNGHTEIVDMLLKAGADLTLKDFLGDTAHMLASRNGHWEIEESLELSYFSYIKRLESQQERDKQMIRRPSPSSPERRERLIRDAGRSLRESLDRDRQMRGLGRSIYDPTN